MGRNKALPTACGNRINLFGAYIIDGRAQISGNFVNDRKRISTNSALTVGLRVGFEY